MPTSIDIVLDQAKAVYFPGQTVAGRIKLTLGSTKKCRGVKVKFKGFSKVHWTERKKEGDEWKTHSYRSSEEYYSTKYYVWGDGSKIELPAGTYTYDFSFLLPKNIPSSFESDHGSVRHVVKASLDLPFAIDKECSRYFSVICIHDLNQMPEVKNPVHKTKTKSLCCLCCKSGPLSFVLNIDKTGYVPGENVILNVECTNMSWRTVEKTKAKITQIVTCYAQGHSKTLTRKVASIEHSEIPPGESDIWAGVTMKLPPLAPSNLPGCNNIKVLYKFEFEMDPGCCAMDLDTDFPIIIGTIPFSNTHLQIMGAPAGSPAATSPSAPPLTLPFPGLQNYPDMPPPSYDQCFFGSKDISANDSDDENNDGKMVSTFAPRYVTYGFK